MRLEAKKFSKGDFAPLTPEILRKAAANISLLMGMCSAVTRAQNEASRCFETSLSKLYCASENLPWEATPSGYLVRFGGHPAPDGEEWRTARRECLLRMAAWLESLDE